MHRLETHSTSSARSRNLSHRVAQFLLRYPFLAKVIKHVVRLFQGRYSAGVVGVVVNPRGEFLLVEHVFHPDCPWGLPGGWMGWREAPVDAVQRELSEETG